MTVHQVDLIIQPKLMYKKVKIYQIVAWPDQSAECIFRVTHVEKTSLLCHISAAVYSALRYFYICCSLVIQIST